MLLAATLAGPEGRKIVAHGESRGMADGVDDQARVSGRQTSCALSDISVAPTGLAGDAYALSHGCRHGPHSAAARRLRWSGRS